MTAAVMDMARTSTYYLRRGRPVEGIAYETFWRFAAERQRIYAARIAGAHGPWTDDIILGEFKFTNVFRASDRVSQYLLRLAYDGKTRTPRQTFLRVLLFKIFNKAETWEALGELHDQLDAGVLDVARAAETLSRRKAAGHSIYSGAYIMPSGGAVGAKHDMHLALLDRMLVEEVPERVADTRSLRELYELLLSYPSFGPFLAFQYAVDLNYTDIVNHDEMEFVVAGPGCLDGISKCFTDLGGNSAETVIRQLVDSQEAEFKRFGLKFDGLWGRRLQPIDIQNVFCEVSKYTRVSHPGLAGKSGRTRIKQRFSCSGPMPRPFFPPKWCLNERIETEGNAISSGAT